MNPASRTCRAATGALVGAAMAATLCAVPASAQWTNPSRLNPREAVVPTDKRFSAQDRGRIVLAQYAKCVLDMRPRAVESALAEYPHSKASEKSMRGLVIQDCFIAGTGQDNSLLGFQNDGLRGALFRVLYMRDFRVDPSPALPAAAILYANDTGGASDADAVRYVVLRQFADCLVRKDPATARAFVTAAPVSPDEKKYFGKIIPHLSACLDSGIEVRLNVEMVSALMAEALYRLSAASRSGGGTQ